jgi:hypothetical protein
MAAYVMAVVMAKIMKMAHGMKNKMAYGENMAYGNINENNQ